LGEYLSILVYLFFDESSSLHQKNDAYSFPFYHNILGTLSFAVSGAFLAMEKKLDPFGILVLAFVTAIGGGTLHDMISGNLPISSLLDSTGIIVILCSGVATLFLGHYLKHLQKALFLFDALGVGLFT